MTLASIVISFNNLEELIELPVLPEKIEVQEKSNNKNHVLQNIGEMTIINTIKEPTLKIESYFPINQDPYVISKRLLRPIEYIEMLKKWRDSKKPMRLIIGSDVFSLSWACTIENLTYSESWGAVGDIQYSIDFKEYRWHKIKRVEQILGTNKGKVVETRPVEREIPKTYTVKEGDTLYTICKRQLGDGNKFREVATKNNISNPKKIYSGQVLKL